MDNASKGLETTEEAARIRGKRRRLRRRDDGPDELATTTEASEDKSEESTTTNKVSAEETEEPTRLSERLQWRSHRCICGPRELAMKMTLVSAEEDRPEDSAATTKEALSEGEE